MVKVTKWRILPVSIFLFQFQFIVFIDLFHSRVIFVYGSKIGTSNSWFYFFIGPPANFFKFAIILCLFKIKRTNRMHLDKSVEHVWDCLCFLVLYFVILSLHGNEQFETLVCVIVRMVWIREVCKYNGDIPSFPSLRCQKMGPRRLYLIIQDTYSLTSECDIMFCFSEKNTNTTLTNQ